MDLLEAVDLAFNYLESILNEMKVKNFSIDRSKTDDGFIFDIKMEDTAIILANNGECLSSLQYLVNLYLNNKTKDYERIIIDCNDFRKKRKALLEDLGKKSALKAFNEKIKVSLEPMNPYERQILHSSIREIKGVKTYSVGDDPHRYVVIEPENA